MVPLLLLCWALFGLAIAQTDCKKSSPEFSLPSCMEKCFLTGGCGGCPCANNLKGWCEISSGEGPDSWFARWGQCVLGACPDDGDITNLMLLYVAQCDDTVGGPLNNDTVPYPLRDWAPKAPQYLSQSSNSPLDTVTSSESRPVATLTGVSPTAIASLGSTTVSTNDSDATVLDDKASSSSFAIGPASATPIVQDISKPALSVAAIIGVAVGGAVLLALVIGFVAFVLRHRKRKQLSTSVSPPSCEGVDTKEGYDKPELDGQVRAYQYSKTDVGAPARMPVVYAELDDGRSASTARELPDRP
ncbi:uncharacterized protein M421DRAFT_7618 [Didymella exigua CBS 183.55]|uniref:Extracellular membrane protein CFEM domain-containing protein n=1 Tax=Didymella exigua CBS 183.55 TaxID=1150837 RepID=A0A6A5RC78_9PLEO|nr:uncharacterized protein M421DRAFT_7618 [Didymella exigua CBS 183.55]KAF1925855.1 hypothetical protein M421DRAFT_7618 [Didymella exigua CBS 183.55]